jgi:hypothetical protein
MIITGERKRYPIKVSQIFLRSDAFPTTITSQLVSISIIVAKPEIFASGYIGYHKNDKMWKR